MTTHSTHGAMALDEEPELYGHASGCPPSNEHGGGHGAMAGPPGGLAIADERFRIQPLETMFPGPGRHTIRFRVLDAHGRVQTEYEEEQERELHLIVVGRDLADYHHLHPDRDAQGVWSVAADLNRAGPYRVIADFESGGIHTTLGYDVAIAGDYRPQRLEPARASAETAGYEVALDEPSSRAMTFHVSRRGEPVEDLDDYLGAKGHLVALREGDLAYLHVHPEPSTVPGTIPFIVHYPSPGRYRLYLQFSHGGAVQTAELTREIVEPHSASAGA